MKKRPKVAVLNTVEDTRANLIQDTTEWGVVKTSAANDLLLGMFRIGKLVRVESFAPIAEIRQLVTLGADATPEVITGSTRYKIEIGNSNDKYESQKRGSIVHAYTSSVTIDADAAVNRLNAYTALVTNINADVRNNVTAYLLTVHDYTLGTQAGGSADNFTAGEVVTQAGSAETARVAKCLISESTMVADTAKGKIWVFDISDTAAWTDTAVVLTGGTSLIEVTQTVTTQVDAQGIVLEDDAGYFISSISRSGFNWVGATDGWLITTAEVTLTPVYAENIGSVMAQLVPRYDQSKQQVISGFLEYELQDGDAFDTAKTYRKYVFTLKDGDENALSAEEEYSEFEIVLYVDVAATHIGDLDTAISALT